LVNATGEAREDAGTRTESPVLALSSLRVTPVLPSADLIERRVERARAQHDPLS
jgi:hypothetical protein